MKYITPSMLKAHAQCPFGYHLRYHEGIVPRVKRSSEVFGTILHATIQRYLKGEILKPVEYFISVWNKEKEFLVYPEGEDGEKLQDIGVKILNILPDFLPQLGEIVEIEQPYEAELPVGTLKGTPDLIVIKDCEKTILDWKIVRSAIEGKEKIDPQLRMYSFLTGVKKAGYIYIKRTKNPEIFFSPIVEIQPREEEIMLWSEQFILMEEGPYYKNVSFFCQMCEYLPLCAEDPQAEELYERQEIPDRYAGVSCKKVRE